MTTINSTNIEFLLSGGANNADPSKSIGGGPSSSPVLGLVNNLFPDITSQEASFGKVDYRCFYVKNSISSATLYDTQVLVSFQNPGASYVEIGVAKSTDVQRIEITGIPTSGTVIFRLGTSPISVNWGTSAFGFEASLRNALLYAGFAAEVVHSISGNTASFTVTFSGVNDNKSWPILQIQENNLMGVQVPIIQIIKISNGQPINSSAPMIVTDQMPPSGVIFQPGSIVVGKVDAGDFFPVWVKRTTPANSQFSINDGFTIKVSGKPFLQASSSSSSSGVIISYAAQPTQTFYQQVFNNTEIHISAQVIMIGSSTNSPVVAWEFSDDNGATWISTLSDPTMSANMSSVTPGTINQTLVLSGVVDSSWYGRKFRVTNSEGPVSVTSNVFTLDLGFSWTKQPSNSAWIGPVGEKYSDFEYSYSYPSAQAFTGGAFQYSDDGINWQDFNPLLESLFSSMSPATGLTERGGSFRVGTFVPGRRYRVKASISNVNIYSNSAFSICSVSECSQFWPAGWSEPTHYADCGLLPEPGFNKYMDCNICECAKVAISSSSS